jgi:hypothetical protein
VKGENYRTLFSPRDIQPLNIDASTILSRMKFCEKKGDGFIDLDRRIRMIDT